MFLAAQTIPCNLANNGQIPVNFYLYFNNSATPPLVQSLVGSTQQRTNVVESFFILSRDNQTWSGVGYVVDTAVHQRHQPALPVS